MPNYGRNAWDIGQLYRAQDAGMRIPFASLLGTPGDQPAQPLPSTMQWREGIPLPTGQVQSKPAQEGRKDDYLRTSLDMLTRSRLPLPSAASVASFLPGGGMVAAGESSRAIPEAVRAGNYGQAGLSALETALNVGGEALPFLKAGALIPGLIRQYGHLEPQKAWQRGMSPEMLARSQLTGGVKPRTDPREWTYDVEPGVLPVERKTFDPATMPVGSAIQPLIGDLTPAGGSLTGIGGRALSEPVARMGGADFPRLVPESAWASGGGVITGVQKRAKEAAEAGAPVVYGMHWGMSPTSGDFSHHNWMPLLRQMKTAKMPAAEVKLFDEAFRGRFPGWPGLKKTKEAEQFLSQSGAARAPFVQELEKSRWQGVGAPEVGPVRFAMTEPGLLGMPTGASGYSVSRLDPAGQPVTSPRVTHPSYPIHAPTLGYEGGTASLLPSELVWRDFYQLPHMQKMTDPSNRAYSFRRAQPTQIVDQQLIDTLGQYLRQR